MKKIICFFFLIFFNVNLVLSAGKIILLNGPTCCGKTRLSKELLDRLNYEDNWNYISLDDVPNEIADDDLHDYVLQRIKQLANQGANVICDTVINNKQDWNYFFDNLKQNNIEVFSIFVHCKLIIALHRLKYRNDRFDKKNIDRRSFHDLLLAFLDFYETSKLDKGLGFFSMSDVGIIFKSSENKLSKESAERLWFNLRKLCCDEVGKVNSVKYLSLTFGNYDMIVNSGAYPSKCCAEQILIKYFKWINDEKNICPMET